MNLHTLGALGVQVFHPISRFSIDLLCNLSISIYKPLLTGNLTCFWRCHVSFQLLCNYLIDQELHMHFSKPNYFQGIPLAPLWDFCKGRFVGVLSVLDFILILREVCSAARIIILSAVRFSQMLIFYLFLDKLSCYNFHNSSWIPLYDT